MIAAVLGFTSFRSLDISDKPDVPSRGNKSPLHSQNYILETLSERKVHLQALVTQTLKLSSNALPFSTF